MSTTAQDLNGGASSAFKSGFLNLAARPRSCGPALRTKALLRRLRRRLRARQLRKLTTDQLASRVRHLEGWAGRTEVTEDLVQKTHLGEFLIALGGGERENLWFMESLRREFYPLRLLLQWTGGLEITLTVDGDGRAVLRLEDDHDGYGVLRETYLGGTPIQAGNWTILWLWSEADGNRSDDLIPFIGNRYWEPPIEADPTPVHTPRWVKEGRTSGFVLYSWDGSNMDPEYSAVECYAADVEAAYHLWTSLWDDEDEPLDWIRGDSASLYILENGIERKVWATWVETRLVDDRSDSFDRTLRYQWFDPELEAAFEAWRKDELDVS